ncbi:alanine racemase [Lapillicoccus jejuensis]|uniref:alanine racemase n=1 Tax=Lapillicoccus jejuensis TaxID=402171 RepID=UPI001FEC4D6F|nr:alanine racemase [Lapillicoccus jejuensis]
MTLTPPEARHLPASAVVDARAIRDNVRRLRDFVDSAEVMAIVKADGYGHGAVTAARAARAGGATWIGAALHSEAVALRDAGVGGRVFTWLHVPGTDFAEAVRRDIDVSCSGRWDLDEVAAGARAAGGTARVHLKVDTGLSRGGAYGPDFTALVAQARALEAEGVVEVVAVWSHLVASDVPASPVTRQQQAVFDDAVREAERAGLRPQLRHVANSAAVVSDPSLHYDLVRPGIAVYGIAPAPQVATSAQLELTPAMTLTARLALVKRVPAGSGVSYGHLYTTPTDTVLGLVPLGYADGIPRLATNCGPISVGGRTYPIAGRVCMDQVVVDLGPDATAREGDEVVVFGPGSGAPTAQDWAEATDTIAYEVVTRVGARVPRVVVGQEVLAAADGVAS